MAWPPKAGEPLPRAAEAWCAREKWTNWILAEVGHGTEWGHVFHVESEQWEAVWEAIAAAVIGALIETVRNLGALGVSCGMTVELEIEGRTASAITAWHYGAEGDAPRLVTAYPRPYNRSHGNGA
jgi:hypothetical protein